MCEEIFLDNSQRLARMNRRLDGKPGKNRVSFGDAVCAQKARMTAIYHVAESACRLSVMRMVADARRDQN